MHIKDHILKDTKIGSSICILLESNQICGKVIYLSPKEIGIESPDEGTVFQKNENILSYRTLDKTNNLIIQKDSIFNIEFNSDKQNSYKNSISIHEALSQTQLMKELAFNQPNTNTSKFLDQIIEENNYFNSINVPAITDYKYYAKNDRSRESKLINQIIKEIEKKISLGFRQATSSKLVTINILKLLQDQTINNEKKDIYNFLGSLYFKSDLYKLSLDYFELGDDNVSGFLLSESCRNYNRQIRFAIRHLFDKKPKQPYIIYFIIHAIVEQDDYSILYFIGQNLRKKLNFLPVYHVIFSIILKYHCLNIDEKLFDKATLDNTTQLYSIFCNYRLGSKKVFFYSLCNAKTIHENSFQNSKIEINPLSERRFNECKSIKQLQNEIVIEESSEKSSPASKELLNENTTNLNYQDFIEKKPSSTIQVNYRNIPDYYALANAAILDKKYNEAIDYFKLALDNNQRVTSSIPQLVSVMTKLEMFTDAYNVLKQFEKTLNSSVYCNLLISIFKKSKDPSNKNECIESYEKLIKMAQENDKSKYFQLKIELSNYLFQINNVEESVERLFIFKDDLIQFVNTLEGPQKALFFNNYFSLLIKGQTKLNNFTGAEQSAFTLLDLYPQTKLKIATKYKDRKTESKNIIYSQMETTDPIISAKDNTNITISQEEIDYFGAKSRIISETEYLERKVQLYKLALLNNQKLTETIPNLVSTLSQLNRYDEALDIVNKFGNKLNEAILCNLKISIFKKSKDTKHISECLNAYNYIIKNAPNPYKALSYTKDCGIYLNEVKEFNLSCEKLLECLISLKTDDISKENKSKLHIPIYSCLIKNYLKLGDEYNAIIIAQEFLELYPQNELAKSVICKGKIKIKNKNNTSFSVLPIDNSNNENEQLFLPNVDYFSSILLFSYTSKLIESSHLKDIASNLVKDDIFIGKFDDAKEIIQKTIESIQKNRLKAPKRHYIILAIAKLYKQVLEQQNNLFEDNFINYEKFYTFIIKGIIDIADWKLYPCSTESLQAARFLYLQPVFMYSHDENSRFKKIPNNDTITAIYRYIATFFVKDDDFNSIRRISFLNTDNTIPDEKSIRNNFSEFLKTIISNGLSKHIDTTSFVVDLFVLLHEFSLIEDALLSAIYFKYIRDDIVQILSKLIGIQTPISFTVEDFRRYWIKAKNIYFIHLNSFIQNIGNTVNQIFSLADFATNLKNLKLFDYNSYLNKTDSKYMTIIYKIFDKIFQFNEISEFDYKTDALREVEISTSSLIRNIENYPTFFSYEFLRKDLKQLLSLVKNESDHLYSNSAPNLRLELLGECSVNSYKRIISIPVVFKNDDNVQTAIVTSFHVHCKNCEEFNDTQSTSIFHIGSNEVQKLIKLKVPNYVMDEDVLDIKLSINYQYKANRLKSIEKSQNFSLSVQINKSVTFESIENKFNILKDGGVVDNQRMFYGRDQFINDLINQVHQSLGCQQGHCIALYGQTRTGKSSVLLHLRRRLRLSSFGASCIIINLDSIGMQDLHDSYIVGFLYSILDALGTELEENHEELLSKLNENEIFLDPDELMKHEDNAQLIFNSIFRKFTSFIAQEKEKYIIIITIDEFTYIYDWIRQGKMSDRIMKFWKAFIQNNPIFAFIIGQDHMMKFVEDDRFSNDFGATDLKKVSYLSKTDAFKLMDEPILLNKDGVLESRYKKGALERLYELTSGSAYLIAMFCAGMVDYLNEIRSVYITKAHVDEYLRLNLHNFEEAKFFDPQYHDKSDIINEVHIIQKNKEILKRIAQMSNNKEWTDLNKVALNEEDRKILYNLEKRDVVIIDHYKRCKIKVALYKEWLIEKYGRSL